MLLWLLMKILVAVPAYNEEPNLVRLLPELKGQLPNGVDFLVINDGSKDGTESLLIKKGVSFISMPTNLGLTSVIRSAFKYALANDYEACIQLDGDGQHVPKEVSKIAVMLRDGIDVVIGSRFTNSKLYKQSLLRRMGSEYIRNLIRLFSKGLSLSDPTSGMRGYSIAAMLQIIDDPNLRPEPDTILYLHNIGLSVKEVPVIMREREFGSSYLTPFKSVMYMINFSISIMFVTSKVILKVIKNGYSSH